jgi:hypothetical protein
MVLVVSEDVIEDYGEHVERCCCEWMEGIFVDEVGVGQTFVKIGFGSNHNLSEPPYEDVENVTEVIWLLAESMKFRLDGSSFLVDWRNEKVHGVHSCVDFEDVAEWGSIQDVDDEQQEKVARVVYLKHSQTDFEREVVE